MTAVNYHYKQPSFSVVNAWGTAGRDRPGWLGAGVSSCDTQLIADDA